MAMNENPIGVTFMPSAENQAEGPRRGNLEGDLGAAFKILSLRLPRVHGARSISPHVAEAPGGENPQAAIFEAMIRAMLNQQGPAGPPTSSAGPAGMRPMGPIGPPSVNILPGDNENRQRFTPPDAPTSSAGPVDMAPMGGQAPTGIPEWADSGLARFVGRWGGVGR